MCVLLSVCCCFTPSSIISSARVTRHVSHVTRHTSHVTRFSSRVTRNTSHITRHTPHVTRHTSHATLHASHTLSLALNATSPQQLVRYKLLRLQIPALDVVSVHLRILHNNIVQTLQEKSDKCALETAASDCTCASHFELHLNFNNEEFDVGIGPCVSVQVENVVSKKSSGASIQNDELCAANNCNLHGTKQWMR